MSAIEVAIEEIGVNTNFICLTVGFRMNPYLCKLLRTFKDTAKQYAVEYWGGSDSWWKWGGWNDKVNGHIYREKKRFLRDLLIEVEKMSEEELIGRIK